MKKNSIFLIITGSILGLGILLTLIGLAFGGKIYSLSIGIGRNKHIPTKSVSHKLPDVSLSDTRDIQSLDFDLTANGIEIKTGKEFSVQGGRLSENTVENGVWTMESYYSDYFYSFEIFGMDLPFPRFWDKKGDYEKLIITLPQNIQLQEVSIEAKASELDIDLLECDELDLEVSAGDASIQSLFTNTADISVSAGQIDIMQYQITDSADIECSAGNLNFGQKRYALKNLCNNLEVECSLGDADVYGKLTGSNSIECSLGDLTLNLPGGRENYSIHSSKSLGDISFNLDQQQSSGSGEIYGALDVDCTMGDIDVNFLGN